MATAQAQNYTNGNGNVWTVFSDNQANPNIFWTTCNPTTGAIGQATSSTSLSTATATSNVGYTGSASLAQTRTINSLRFVTTSGGQTLNLGANNLTITSGGIMRGIGEHNYSINCTGDIKVVRGIARFDNATTFGSAVNVAAGAATLELNHNGNTTFLRPDQSDLRDGERHHHGQSRTEREHRKFPRSHTG